MIVDQKTYLEHYGVKGMKWGVRRDRTGHKPSGREIKEARARLREGGKAIREKNAALEQTKSRSAAEKKGREIRKIAKDLRDSGDVEIASRLTAGEKAAHVLIYGAFAPVTIRNAQRSNYNVDTAFLANVQEAKVVDLRN